MGPFRILVVDDDMDFAEVMADALTLNGHRVEIALSGEEAIRKFSVGRYDITFMDVKLPGMNGVESFMEIRRLKPDARVVMMTAFGVPSLLDAAISNGAWGVFRKPMDIEKMLGMLRRIAPVGVVLFPDHDPNLVNTVKRALQANGYKVYVAQDGREALRKARSDGVDALILDLRMPLLSRLELFMELEDPDMLIAAPEVQKAGCIAGAPDSPAPGFSTKPFHAFKPALWNGSPECESRKTGSLGSSP